MPIEVAVKIYKGNVDNEKLIEIMHEVRIMLQFDHENVVKFVGIAACRSPMLIVLELVHGGGLNRYLKIKKNEVTTMQRICMCADAANGLDYIHSLGIVHRDVASRNCLYSQSKQRTLISDFGLSQQEEVCTIDPTKPLPIRWLAPEVMTTYQCTKMTDVWSYGVLCWEIFYHCQDPYSFIKKQKDVIEQVISGVRLDFTPENVPQPIIDVVVRCWDISPTARPTVKEISTVIVPLCERPSTKNKKKDNSSKTKDTSKTKEFQQNRSRRGQIQPESGSNRDSNRSHHERQRKSGKAIDPPAASNSGKKRSVRNRKKNAPL
uniref:Protein kinase domain-containing protein n=1 Tax=Panagrolaimus superbus TaxID=310955 RepID=A0A914Z4H8_9BILA